MSIDHKNLYLLTLYQLGKAFCQILCMRGSFYKILWFEGLFELRTLHLNTGFTYHIMTSK